MLLGKQKEVVLIHNKLHKIVCELSSAADTLEVTPALETHTSTCEQVAVAMRMLSDCKVASVVCEAVDILKTHRLTPVGPGKSLVVH